MDERPTDSRLCSFSRRPQRGEHTSFGINREVKSQGGEIVIGGAGPVSKRMVEATL